MKERNGNNTFIEETVAPPHGIDSQSMIPGISHRFGGSLQEQASRYAKFPEPYTVSIPVRTYSSPQVGLITEAKAELASLTIEELQTESFQEFYRHIHMLSGGFGFPAADVARFIPVIIDRTTNETAGFVRAIYPNNPPEQRFQTRDIYFLTMSCLEKSEEDTNVRLSQNLVKQLYELALTAHPRFLRYALTADRRNRMFGESIGLAERVKEQLAQELINPSVNDENKASDFLDWTYADPDLNLDLLTYSLLRADFDEAKITSILQRLAPVMGVEKIRKRLREYVEANSSFHPTFNIAFDYMHFDPEDIAIDLERDIYGKIDFSQYKPNEETQAFEVSLLEEQLSKFQDRKDGLKVLDVACGTGRHLEALDGRHGIQVTGIDLVPRHIDYIKQHRPESDVSVASWFDIPAADGEFDAAYCLGRSFMHNTTIPDAVACLEEMKRVINDDGFIILDLPEPTVGEYDELIKKTAALAEKRGLRGILPGTIIDSPDSQHYYDRYAPHPFAFLSLVELAGLHAEELIDLPYQGASGVENINTYWKLTKVLPPPDISASQRASLIRKIRTKLPSLIGRRDSQERPLLHEREIRKRGKLKSHARPNQTRPSSSSQSEDAE